MPCLRPSYAAKAVTNKWQKGRGVVVVQGSCVATRRRCPFIWPNRLDTMHDRLRVYERVQMPAAVQKHR